LRLPVLDISADGAMRVASAVVDVDGITTGTSAGHDEGSALQLYPVMPPDPPRLASMVLTGKPGPWKLDGTREPQSPLPSR